MAKHGKAKTKKSPKKLIITLVVLVLVAGAAVGGYFLWQTYGGEEINVYPVEDLSMDYAWATEAQTDGRVTTDKLQSVYISQTQQITEIYVEEGQTLSVGDPILAFDTTLNQLELDRQAITVSQLELELQEAKDYLAEIDTFKVGSPPTPDYSPITGELHFPPTIPYYQKGIGTAEDPMVYLWNDNCAYDSAFILELAALSAQLKAEQVTPDAPEQPEDDISGGGTVPPSEENTPDEGGDTGEDTTSPEDEGSDIPGDETTPSEGEGNDTPDEEVTPPTEETAPPAGEPELPEKPEDPYVYVVFEVRESDALNGVVLRYWELAILTGEDGSWIFQIVEPAYEPAEDNIIEPDYSDIFVDNSVYYTAAEIAQMKAETKQKIIDLNLQLKMAELEYDRLAYELSSGVVYSTIDGVVKTVRDVETARAENQPVVLVSGGGGYYVTAALSEMELASMHVGDTVTVQSWENYSDLEGEIIEISEYPDESGQYWHYSEGNQNISLYPFTVFLSEDAGLREGEWVTVTYDPGGEDSGGFYVEIPFILQENGKSYVYAAGEDGRLEKRLLATGGNLWGSYIKVLDGLTEEDHIAFPYGRGIKDGAKLRYAEIDELYSY